MCASERLSITAAAAFMLIGFANLIAPALAQSPPKRSDCDWIELSTRAVDAGRVECSVYRAPFPLPQPR